MADYRYVHFEHPEAQRLADLNGVSFDLALVSDLCDEFEEIDYLSSTHHLAIAQAIFMAAVVAYGRTFGSAVRSGVKREQLELLPDALQHRHQYFKDIRDKFIAHSVNAFEENCVKLYLVPPERGAPGVAFIGLGHSRVATLSHEDMAHLKELAIAVASLVEVEMESEKSRLLEYSKTLPIEDIYLFPEPQAFRGGGLPSKVRRRLGEA